MSVTHGQPGLSSEQRSDIRRTILSARHTLEKEIRRQLELYGIYEDERLSLDSLSHLSVAQRKTRQEIDAALERELESTEGDLERSITNYVREATKTYLNRFVALKTIEIRGLIEETVTERPEFGNRSYMHYTVDEIAGELTDTSDDGYGAALDLAYQEIGAEIRIIFEDSEYTTLDLDPQVRSEVLDSLEAIDDNAWESDEALGWVYQYFGEEQREDIDNRIKEENYKVSGKDIATKTQLFTPRYIVEWMVDNSLGRTWLEMQGDATSIDSEENCYYLAPLQESLHNREPKPVEEITVFDPACGSGHMLFYAFEVLYQMYLEEGEVPEAYIPREILRNNLFGLDIDSGAAQIAALSLYLKAKERSPGVSIPQLNIASADAVLVNGDRKEEVLNNAQSPIEEEIVEQLWLSFENIRECGSLIRIEQEINEIFEKYRDKFDSGGQAQFTSDGKITDNSTYVSGGGEETWDNLRNRLIAKVQSLAESAIEHNEPIDEIFAEEVGKSIKLIDLFLDEYDVVLSNPPYLGSAKMGDSLKQHVKTYHGNRDLCTAFIERCTEFASDGDSYVSMVTQENFTFLSSYSDLRSYLLKNSHFVEGLHLSRNSFDIGERPATISFLLRKNSSTQFEHSRFYRMTHDQENYSSYTDKITGLNSITEALRDGQSHDDIYIVDQNTFTDIGRQPYIYWLGREVLDLFSTYPKLDTTCEVLRGLDTGNDDRFVRKWWEYPDENNGDWRPYMKSGSKNPFYEPLQDNVYWGEDGGEIKEYDGSIVPNESHYFKSGLAYRSFGKQFTVRHLPEECIPSDTSPAIFPERVQQDVLLGYLNSSLVDFLLQGINPSMRYQVGDIEEVVIDPTLNNPELGELSSIGRKIEKQKQECKEINPCFNQKTLVENWANYNHYIDEHIADIEIIKGVNNEIVFDHYDISPETRAEIERQRSVNLNKFPHISNAGELESTEYRFRSDIETNNIPEEEYKKLVEHVDSNVTDTIREISKDLEISPHTVALVKQKHNLYSGNEREEKAGRLLSFVLGCAVGRWEIGIHDSDPSEILQIDDGFRSVVTGIIGFVLKQGSEDVVQTIENIIGDSVESWFQNNFFRYYHCKEYRRRGQRIPIYWQLESPNGAFSCFIYYHGIDENTLPKLRGQYLDPRIDELSNELDTLRAQTSGDNPDKELLERREQVEDDLDDIKDFRDTIDEMIDDGVTVDVEEGIWENIKVWDQYEVLQTGLPKLKSSYSR